MIGPGMGSVIPGDESAKSFILLVDLGGGGVHTMIEIAMASEA